jgi:hypothetical protein
MGKTTSVEASVWDAVIEGLDELQELEFEMAAWKDSLLNTNLYNSRTFWRVQAAADALPIFHPKKSDIPTAIQDSRDRSRIHVTARTRPERRDDAVAKLLAVVNLIQTHKYPDIAAFRSFMLNIVDQVENIEFFGMR